jgi:hypothetical protein
MQYLAEEKYLYIYPDRIKARQVQLNLPESLYYRLFGTKRIAVYA